MLYASLAWQFLAAQDDLALRRNEHERRTSEAIAEFDSNTQEINSIEFRTSRDTVIVHFENYKPEKFVYSPHV